MPGKNFFPGILFFLLYDLLSNPVAANWVAGLLVLSCQL